MPHDLSDYRVCGFLMNDKQLLAYALKNRLGTDEDDWQKHLAMASAADLFMSQHDIFPSTVAGVKVNGEVRFCAAIASESHEDRLPMPDKTIVEKLKKAFRTEREPQWFIHV
ncbi:hypothetical protein DFH06DRAFT_1292900 [Mycena polygramma]|nr:hypothetical protein DFH06DRAFT_1292900 [Mycena polygramma]